MNVPRWRERLPSDGFERSNIVDHAHQRRRPRVSAVSATLHGVTQTMLPGSHLLQSTPASSRGTPTPAGVTSRVGLPDLRSWLQQHLDEPVLLLLELLVCLGRLGKRQVVAREPLGTKRVTI